MKFFLFVNDDKLKEKILDIYNYCLKKKLCHRTERCPGQRSVIDAALR